MTEARRRYRYHDLDPTQVANALEKLHARVAERFPGAGLEMVSRELVETGRTTAARARRVTGPYVWLRVLSGLAIAAAVAAEAFVLGRVDWSGVVARTEFVSLAQGLDATFNLVLLTGGGAWFMIKLEQRLRQTRVLSALHELRSFAHVIDMHQLTKDPTARGGPRTASSPDRAMTPYEISRYLDYCAEMLALTAKLAAIYAGASRDPVIIEAVNDVENLAADMSRNIWQKLVIISRDAGALSPPAA